MKLKELGEFGLINRIAPQFTSQLPQGTLGIGDDCAVIHQSDRALLITTDLLVENIHFLRRKISAFDLGYKSLAVNLSDIAAMGGVPNAAFLSVAWPKEIDVDWLDEFFSGFAALAQESGTTLLGGDTTGTPGPIIINVAVIGHADPAHLKLRSAAQVGDVICVTGCLGDSAGGLQLLLWDLDAAADEDGLELLRAHHRPRPHLKEGQWLAQQPEVHAMMDVSDGIDSDVRRIMEASKVGARIFLHDLPISESLRRTAAANRWNALELAAAGGEDYCLLCTADPEAFPKIAELFAAEFDCPLTCIGTIMDTGKLEYELNGATIDLQKHGWDHFRS
ncbi:MAG: thiamine-phosphate kinase [candidate division KSB1 bacterium]|nr:thiamine-phosphate kinase [candidate division KSB1 bacterium]